MDVETAPQQQPKGRNRHRILRRWNSIATYAVVAPATDPSSALELLSIKPASHRYSSLRDLLPAENCRKIDSVLPGSDICIRNRLVKQAAWAYLRPMATSSASTGGCFFQRIWRYITAFIDLFCRNAIRALDGSLQAIRMRGSSLANNGMSL